MATWAAILLGLVLGSLAAGVLALFLGFTRAARRVRNPFVICLGYTVVGISAIGSVLALLTICDRLGIDRHGPQHYNALYAYTVSYACEVFVFVRREARWRQSVGLDDKSLMSMQNMKH
jgi:hypothetical protein